MLQRHPTSSGDKLRQGQLMIQSAVELDVGERWHEAVEAYEQGSLLIAQALPSVSNAKLSSALQERLATYCERQGVLERKLGGSAPKPRLKPLPNAAQTQAAKLDQLEPVDEPPLVQPCSDCPKVEWSDIAGLDLAKQRLREAVVEPLAHPEWFTGDSRPPRAILLYGPGGTGKTHLAHAVATATEAKFYSVSSSDLLSKYQGESERSVRQLFEKARASSPSVVFIDEIDSIARRRGEAGASESTDRIKTELMVQMSSHSNSGVLVLGATNMPWSLDSAVVRRFEVRVYIALPDAGARRSLVDAALRRNEHSLTADQCQTIVDRTSGFSGSDMVNLLRQGLTQRLRAAQSAKWFKLSEGDDAKWSVCEEGDAGAQFKCWSDFKPGETRPVRLSFDMLLRALTSVKASTQAKDHQAFDAWTLEFGEPG